MFKFGKSREKVFIFTTLDQLEGELSKEEYRKKHVVVGLANDDFRIALINRDPSMTVIQQEEDMEDQLRMMIVGYDPMDYVTKTLTEQKEEHNERLLAISLDRDKIQDIVELCKENKIKLKGIYPSFILDEQENLADILMQLPSINVGESLVTEDELEDLHLDKNGESEKINLLLTEDGEPLNVRRQINEGTETEYNFMDQALESEMKQSLLFDRVVKIFWAALFIMLLAFGGLKVDQYLKNSKIAQVTAKNQQTDSRIKELESKIASIPNFEMKLKKLQEIMNNKNPGANEVLFALRKSVAKGVFVENVKMVGNKIELVGTAETTDGVYEFQRNLLREGFFNITSSPLNNAGQFYTFKIEANIK